MCRRHLLRQTDLYQIPNIVFVQKSKPWIESDGRILNLPRDNFDCLASMFLPWVTTMTSFAGELISKTRGWLDHTWYYLKV